MKFYLLVLGILSMTCSLNAQNPACVTQSGRSEENKNTTPEKIQVPEILTKLDVLDYVKVEGYQLTFKSVVSDGRCPKDVTCVWPGEAEILIEINDGTEIIAKRIAIPALGFEKEILSTLTHRIYLKNLVPYPLKANESIEAYQLLIKIQPI